MSGAIGVAFGVMSKERVSVVVTFVVKSTPASRRTPLTTTPTHHSEPAGTGSAMMIVVWQFVARPRHRARAEPAHSIWSTIVASLRRARGGNLDRARATRRRVAGCAVQTWIVAEPDRVTGVRGKRRRRRAVETPAGFDAGAANMDLLARPAGVNHASAGRIAEQAAGTEHIAGPVEADGVASPPWIAADPKGIEQRQISCFWRDLYALAHGVEVQAFSRVAMRIRPASINSPAWHRADDGELFERPIVDAIGFEADRVHLHPVEDVGIGAPARRTPAAQTNLGPGIDQRHSVQQRLLGQVLGGQGATETAGEPDALSGVQHAEVCEVQGCRGGLNKPPTASLIVQRFPARIGCRLIAIGGEGEGIEPRIERLTLRSRDGWADIPAEASPNDHDLGWSDRPQSIIGRPLLAIDMDEDPLIAVAPAVIERAAAPNLSSDKRGQSQSWP